MALWMWSFTLQRKVIQKLFWTWRCVVLKKQLWNTLTIPYLFKAFVSWFQYVEEKKRKKAAINKALERRQQWLHKVAVTHWIEVSSSNICKSLWYFWVAIIDALSYLHIESLNKYSVFILFQFATYFIAERERFAALRHIQVSGSSSTPIEM